MRLWLIALVAVPLLAGCGSAGTSASHVSRPSSGQSDTTTQIDVPLTAQASGTATLYVLKAGSQPIGRFVTGCPNGRTPTSAYVAAGPSGGALEWAAVDGRGASRSAQLLAPQRLRGGVGAGLEHWVLRASVFQQGQAEGTEVTADLSLTAFRFGNRGCQFALIGSLTVHGH
jgi:hypothetical protein